VWLLQLVNTSLRLFQDSLSVGCKKHLPIHSDNIIIIIIIIINKNNNKNIVIIINNITNITTTTANTHHHAAQLTPENER
ncbi:hypothetical protein CH063_14977, partial [Colletotrichum higginsianum]